MMQESTFFPNLKNVEPKHGKVVFQHEANIPYVAPIVILVAEPIASPLVARLSSVLSNDDDDQKGLMSSLRKLFEKNKLVKYLEKTLGEVLDRI